MAAWRQIILGIAKEEMGHLATVLNLLRFIGAPIALDREDYPWDSDLVPYPFALERLTRATLAKYILAESPEKWPADVSAAERAEIERLAAGPGKARVNRVGVLYDELTKLFGDASRLPMSRAGRRGGPGFSNDDRLIPAACAAVPDQEPVSRFVDKRAAARIMRRSIANLALIRRGQICA